VKGDEFDVLEVYSMVTEIFSGEIYFEFFIKFKSVAPRFLSIKSCNNDVGIFVLFVGETNFMSLF